MGGFQLFIKSSFFSQGLSVLFWLHRHGNFMITMPSEGTQVILISSKFFVVVVVVFCLHSIDSFSLFHDIKTAPGGGRGQQSPSIRLVRRHLCRFWSVLGRPAVTALMCMSFFVYGMKNCWGEDWSSLEGLLDKVQVHIPSSGKKLGYACVLCYVMEMFSLFFWKQCVFWCLYFPFFLFFQFFFLFFFSRGSSTPLL